MKEKWQRLGGFMAGMVIPNIAAFIAWGFITAFFIPTGWTPNEGFAALVGPMITYLLPILIGFRGGQLIYDTRGGVVGAVATMGVIAGSDLPMFLGAMIMGPVGGWLIKKIDEALEDKVPSGFEMLISNFSAGILAMILAMIAKVVIGPVVTAGSNVLASGVQALIDARLLPLADIPIEVGKVLFLNNAINHGILAPLGVAEVARSGKAIHFLLETNPGPGLGLLAAYWAVGKGMAKESAPSAIIIHFLGGIHEIYFPYVLMQPIMIVAMWAGGIVADTVFMITGAGLVATPSPGSIFAELAMTPRGAHVGVLSGIFLGAVASFLVGSFLLKAFPIKEEEAEASV